MCPGDSVAVSFHNTHLSLQISSLHRLRPIQCLSQADHHTLYEDRASVVISQMCFQDRNAMDIYVKTTKERLGPLEALILSQGCTEAGRNE